MPKQTDSKQIALAFIFAIAIMSNFFVVGAVNYYYGENGIATYNQVFESDSSTEFDKFDYGGTGWLDPYWTDLQTSYRIKDGVDYFQYNKTSVYIGNNTWQISVNESTASGGASVNQVAILIELPQLNNWILHNVTLNLKYAIQDSRIALIPYHYNSGYIYGDTLKETLIFNDPSADVLQNSFGWYNKTIPVNIIDSLRIYDITQETNHYGIYIILEDADQDGFLASVIQFKIEITAQQVTGISQLDVLTYGFIGGDIFLLFVIIYMTDYIDLNGYINHAKQYTKRRKTTKSRKSKRKR